MSLLEADLGDERQWGRVGDHYEVNKKPRHLDRLSVAAIPFVTMAAIPQGGAYAPAFTFRSADAISSGTYFECGDILVAKITPSFENGKQAMVHDLPEPFGYATREVIPLRPREVEQDSRLLFFYLFHPDVRHFVAERIEGSTERQRVLESVLLDLPMPTVGFNDQTAMANALELVQHTLAANSRCKAKAQDLKRNAMRSLFTRGLRGEALKETEIGPMPESWNEVEFQAVLQWLQYGTSTRCTYEPMGCSVLGIPNIASDRIDARDIKFGMRTADRVAQHQLEESDLLFVRTNDVIEHLGTCAVFGGEPKGALFASYLIPARLKLDRINPRFAAYLVGSENGTHIIAWRATPASDGKYNLNSGTVDSLPIPLPPTLEEQNEIVTAIDAFDRKIDLLRCKHTILDDLFKTLLHELIIGELRVTDLDLSALLTVNSESEFAHGCSGNTSEIPE